MKKNYVVSVQNPNDWEYVHELLVTDGTLEDNIPTRSCECTDLQIQNLDRATYLLDDDEVELLNSNEKIKYVEIDSHFHPKVLSEIQLKSLELRRALNRFSSASKVYRQAKDSSDSISPPNSFTHGNAPGTYATVNVSEKDRVPYSITRLQNYNDDFAYDNPAITEPIPTFASYSEGYKEFYPSNYANWYTQKSIKKPSEVKNVNIQYENDGSDIDIVIVDDGVWLGHPEFVNSDGTRQVRDIIIDGPYHIDPAAFAPGNPHGHTTITVMGVTTPTDASARLWWTDSSKRSSQFSSIGTLNLAGLTVNYTLTGINGSNTAYANRYASSATHGTSCAGVAYGKTFGHAFNSNKWTLYYAGYDSEATLSLVNMYTALKLFHKHKPVNETYGTRNPTLLNFSIQSPAFIFYDGYDLFTDTNTSSWYWKWRSSTGSFDAISIVNQGTPSNLNVVPPFLRTSPYLTFYEDNGFGLVGTFNMDTSLSETLSTKSAMEDLIQEPGVFAFVASGNQRQKIVKYSSDANNDYNNYVSPDGGTTKYYCNRGWFVDLLQDETNDSPVFAVGATDANKVLDANDNLYKERLTFFSGRGSRIDIYAPGDDVLTAAGEPDTSASSGPHFYPRYDGNSEGSVGTTKAYSSLGVNAYDSRFNGTSCATPIACGWFATILQNRRNWTPLKLKSYIKNSIQNQSSSTFYTGTESTTGTDANHYDLYTVEGGDAKLLYNAVVPTISIITHPQTQTINGGSSVTFSVTATQDSITGTLSYQWQRSIDGGSTWFNVSGATSNSYTFATSNSNNGNKYRVLISGTGGVDDTYSNVATLNVNSNVKLSMSGNIKITNIKIR